MGTIVFLVTMWVYVVAGLFVFGATIKLLSWLFGSDEGQAIAILLGIAAVMIWVGI